MENQEKFTELLIAKTKGIASQNKHTYILEVSEWAARVFIEGTRKEVTHYYDPPWDSSGQLVETGKPFSLEDYTTLGSFIENEYNGMTEASYLSGCGLFHRTYWDNFEELTRSWVIQQLETALKSLSLQYEQPLKEYIKEINYLDEEANTIEDMMTVLIDENDIVDLLLYGYSFELMTEIQEMDFTFLVKKSESMMREKVEKERMEAIRQAELQDKQRKTDNQIAERIWNELAEEHKTRYQKNIPSYIDRPYFKIFIYPLLQDMIKSGTNREDIKKLAQFYSHLFSNSVSSDFSMGNF